MNATLMVSHGMRREKAGWFARRFQGELLITATVNKQDVHAVVNRRQEQEVIVEKILVTSRGRLLNAAQA